MKNEERMSAPRRISRIRGSASTGPKRPWESVRGSGLPRAIQSVSASRSNVNAQAARASRGQRGGGAVAAGGGVIGEADSSPLGCTLEGPLSRALDQIHCLQDRIGRALVG